MPLQDLLCNCAFAYNDTFQRLLQHEQTIVVHNNHMYVLMHVFIKIYSGS